MLATLTINLDDIDLISFLEPQTRPHNLIERRRLHPARVFVAIGRALRYGIRRDNRGTAQPTRSTLRNRLEDFQFRRGVPRQRSQVVTEAVLAGNCTMVHPDRGDMRSSGTSEL